VTRICLRRYKEVSPNSRCGWRVSGRMEERQRSVQVIVERRLLVEDLSDPACKRPARVVRDMRKSSVFEHGRFPDAHC